MPNNPQVDSYIANAQKWQVELKALRKILLDCQLTEELKWKTPCYVYQQSNVAILGELKDSCVLSFFKGALLKDPQAILSKPGENTQAARVIRFTDAKEIEKLKSILEVYIHEAIAIEKAGLKVDRKANTELEIPEELQNKFAADPAFEAAFDALTPGRQRAYVMFFAAAKQSQTRAARIEKYVSQIMAGQGMNDCTCGLSKRVPGCDGSHKDLR